MPRPVRQAAYSVNDAANEVRSLAYQIKTKGVEVKIHVDEEVAKNLVALVLQGKGGDFPFHLKISIAGD